MEKPNVRFHDGQILSEEPLNKAMEAVDYAVEEANKVPDAVNAASSAAGSASAAAASAAAIQEALEAIKNSGDIPAATVAQVAENTAGISQLALKTFDINGGNLSILVNMEKDTYFNAEGIKLKNEYSVGLECGEVEVSQFTGDEISINTHIAGNVYWGLKDGNGSVIEVHQENSISFIVPNNAKILFVTNYTYQGTCNVSVYRNKIIPQIIEDTDLLKKTVFGNETEITDLEIKRGYGYDLRGKLTTGQWYTGYVCTEFSANPYVGCNIVIDTHIAGNVTWGYKKKNGMFLSQESGSHTIDVTEDIVSFFVTNYVPEGDMHIYQVTKSIKDQIDDINKKYNDSINNKFINNPLIKSYGEIIELSDFDIISNCETSKQFSKVKFSKECCNVSAINDGRCIIKKHFDEAKKANQWTFVFYIYPNSFCAAPSTVIESSISGYIKIYFNSTDSTPVSTYNATNVGWNYFTITTYDYADLNNLNVDDVFIEFIPSSNVEIGAKFFDCILDSIVLDLYMKPTVLLNFDQVWDEMINNGGYQYLFDNNIQATLFSSKFSSQSLPHKEIIKKMINRGWDIGYYGGYNGYNNLAQIPYKEGLAECRDMKSDLIETFDINPSSYATPQGRGSKNLEQSVIDGGFTMYRALLGRNYPDRDFTPSINYFDKNCHWMPIFNIEDNVVRAKQSVDKTINCGLVLPLFTHQSRNDDTPANEATSVRLSVFKSVIDYIVSKRDSGQLSVMTFKDFYKLFVK